MDQTPAPTELRSDAADVTENKDIAALSYVWVLSVFLYFLKRKSPFVRFHAKQGMILFLLSILFWFIPIVGRVAVLGIFGLCALGFLGAAQGEWKDVPVVGPLSRNDWKNIRTSWREFLTMLTSLVHRRKNTAAAPTPPATPSTSNSPMPPTPPTLPLV